MGSHTPAQGLPRRSELAASLLVSVSDLGKVLVSPPPPEDPLLDGGICIVISTTSSWALVNSLQPDPQGNRPLCGLGPLAPGPEWTQRENHIKAGSDLRVCPLLWYLGTIPSSLDQLLSLWQLVPYDCLLPGGEIGFVVLGEPSWRVLGSPLILP